VALILVIDDELSVAQVLQSALSDAGHEVVTAVNGQEGLERLRERRPDLILVDFMMPIMSGPAMLEAMSRDRACPNIPVVIMSSLPGSVVEEAAAGHFKLFLRKPFKLTAVMAAVNALLGEQN
jgi:CheY-like chemotaxis protein